MTGELTIKTNSDLVQIRVGGKLVWEGTIYEWSRALAFQQKLEKVKG